MALMFTRENHALVGSRKQQTAVDQAITVATEFGTNGRYWPTTQMVFPTRDANRRNKKEVIFGANTRFDAGSEEIRVGSSLSAQWRMEPDVAGAMLSFALGAITETGTGADFANRYQQTVKFQTGVSQPITGFAIYDGTEKNVFKDLFITSLKFSGASPSETEILLDAVFLGLGNIDLDQTITIPAVVTNKPCRMSNFSLTWGPDSSEVEIANLIANWEVNINLGAGETHQPGTDGKEGNTHDNSGEPEVTLRLKFKKDSTDKTLRAILDGDPETDANLRAATITMKAVDHAESGAATARQIILTLPQLETISSEDSDFDGKHAFDVQQRALFAVGRTGYTAGDAGPLVATIDNGTDPATYLANMT